MIIWKGGEQIEMNRVTGFLPSKIMFYLSNLRNSPKVIYFVRHGESEFNAKELIGGDSSLTEKGRKFADRLAFWVKENIPSPENSLCVWSSTMKRAVETSENIPCAQCILWKALEEIQAGICDGLTYKQIEEIHPKEFDARQNDKLRYRYPRGESYEDIIRRIEPVIIELEQRNTPVMIVAHQAVLRCIYGYFSKHNFARETVPHIDFPAHCIIKLTPSAFGGTEEHHYFK